MSFDKVGAKRTICEVVREIHDITDKDNVEVIKRLEEVTHMAKRMVVKLTEYKKDWADGFFKMNTDVNEKHKIRT